jgi:hypothetical protein
MDMTFHLSEVEAAELAAALDCRLVGYRLPHHLRKALRDAVERPDGCTVRVVPVTVHRRVAYALIGYVDGAYDAAELAPFIRHQLPRRSS